MKMNLDLSPTLSSPTPGPSQHLAGDRTRWGGHPGACPTLCCQKTPAGSHQLYAGGWQDRRKQAVDSPPVTRLEVEAKGNQLVLG